MPREGSVRTSLEVGFPDAGLPERFVKFRGRDSRAIPISDEFPFEDAQFELVMMSADAVTRALVKEAHRVLKPSGSLLFTVQEKTTRQGGFTLPEIYATLRDGFNIINVSRPPWWYFGIGGRTITICAEKKAWKPYKGIFRTGMPAISPFRSVK